MAEMHFKETPLAFRVLGFLGPLLCVVAMFATFVFSVATAALVVLWIAIVAVALSTRIWARVLRERRQTTN